MSLADVGYVTILITGDVLDPNEPIEGVPGTPIIVIDAYRVTDDGSYRISIGNDRRVVR